MTNMILAKLMDMKQGQNQVQTNIIAKNLRNVQLKMKRNRKTSPVKIALKKENRKSRL